jgi:hypothetical protein
MRCPGLLRTQHNFDGLRVVGYRPNPRHQSSFGCVDTEHVFFKGHVTFSLEQDRFLGYVHPFCRVCSLSSHFPHKLVRHFNRTVRRVSVTYVTEKVPSLSLPLSILLYKTHKPFFIRLAKLLVHLQVIHISFVLTSLFTMHTFQIINLLCLSL